MTAVTRPLSVIGCGYLGAVHAAAMADLGAPVVGVDIDAVKVAALNAGTAPFYEPGLDELLARALASGRLHFTTDLAEAAALADVHFLCVGTPQRLDGNAADLTYVDAAVEALAPLLTRPSLVVGKSTVPVGTAERLAAVLRDTAPAGDDARLAWNPEFLREGFAVKDTVSPDRLVVGVGRPEDAELLREVYAPVLAGGMPWLVTDLATAQLVKTAANAFLATKISFINAMAELCEVAGGDVVELADAIGLDERIGRRFLQAGLGFGGGCLPKDIRAFMARADELGVQEALGFLREVDDINLRRRRRALDLTRGAVGGSLAGRRVTVLGAAFKPDSDDVRDSPALDVALAIAAEGASVVVHDPQAMANARRIAPELAYADDAMSACRDADIVLHLTEWRQYRELDPVALADTVASPRLIDARNALDLPLWRAAGWHVWALGRPTVGGREPTI